MLMVISFPQIREQRVHLRKHMTISRLYINHLNLIQKQTTSSLSFSLKSVSKYNILYKQLAASSKLCRCLYEQKERLHWFHTVFLKPSDSLTAHIINAHFLKLCSVNTNFSAMTSSTPKNRSLLPRFEQR